MKLLKLLEATKKPHHKLAFALGFYECMRIGEVVKLKPENIDKQTKLIHIIQSKGAKDRNIPIAPEVIKGLRLLPQTVPQFIFLRVLNFKMCL